jgi:hypothetical protein
MLFAARNKNAHCLLQATRNQRSRRSSASTPSAGWDRPPSGRPARAPLCLPACGSSHSGLRVGVGARSRRACCHGLWFVEITEELLTGDDTADEGRCGCAGERSSGESGACCPGRARATGRELRHRGQAQAERGVFPAGYVSLALVAAVAPVCFRFRFQARGWPRPCPTGLARSRLAVPTGRQSGRRRLAVTVTGVRRPRQGWSAD